MELLVSRNKLLILEQVKCHPDVFASFCRFGICVAESSSWFAMYFRSDQGKYLKMKRKPVTRDG